MTGLEAEIAAWIGPRARLVESVRIMTDLSDKADIIGPTKIAYRNGDWFEEFHGVTVRELECGGRPRDVAWSWSDPWISPWAVFRVEAREHGGGAIVLVSTYRDYLASPAWRRRRDERIAMDGGRCTRCGSTSALEVHHVSYAWKGAERMSDLRTLCRPCHQLVHR